MKVPTTVAGTATIVESTVTRKRIVGRRNRIMDKRSWRFVAANGMVVVIFVVDAFKGIKTVTVQADSLMAVSTQTEDNGKRKRKENKGPNENSPQSWRRPCEEDRGKRKDMVWLLQFVVGSFGRRSSGDDPSHRKQKERQE
jgi:hypothetical protein